MRVEPNGMLLPAVTASASVGIVPVAVYGPLPVIVTATVIGVMPVITSPFVSSGMSVTGDTGGAAKFVAVRVNSVPG